MYLHSVCQINFPRCCRRVKQGVCFVAGSAAGASYRFRTLTPTGQKVSSAAGVNCFADLRWDKLCSVTLITTVAEKRPHFHTGGKDNFAHSIAFHGKGN